MRNLIWLLLALAVLGASSAAGWTWAGVAAATGLAALLALTGASGWRLGQVGLELRPIPAVAGQPLELTAEIAPRRGLQVGRVLLRLLAHQTAQGQVETLLDRTYELAGSTAIERGRRWRKALELRLPESVPPSGPGPQGQVVWLAELTVSVPGWPDYFEVRPIEVLPPGAVAVPDAGDGVARRPARALLPGPGCLLLLHLPLVALFLLLAGIRPASIHVPLAGAPLRGEARADAFVPRRAYLRLRLLDRPGTRRTLPVQVTLDGKTTTQELAIRYPADGRQPHAMGYLGPTEQRVSVTAPAEPGAPRPVGGELALAPARHGIWPLIWLIGSFLCGAAFWITLSLGVWRLQAGQPRTWRRAGCLVLAGFLLHTGAMALLVWWAEPFPWRWLS